MCRKALFFALIVISISSLTVFAFKKTILTKMSQFLVIETHENRHYDTAIVLSGGAGERMNDMIRYHKKNPFQNIILTGNTTFHTSWPQIMKDYANQKGIHNTPIHLETKSWSTYENATKTRPIVTKLQSKNILIFTSKFHTKRSHLTFKKAYQGMPNTLHIKGTEDRVKHDQWWNDPEMSQKVLIEWGKVLFYKLKKRI